MTNIAQEYTQALILTWKLISGKGKDKQLALA
jgi:hypothetical protein